MSTSIKGNIDYTKTVLEEEHIDEAGQLVGSWQTDKVVYDAAEQEAAVKVRSKARGFITSVCAKSDFGYLCPESREADLEAAIKKAIDVCADFNFGARITEVNFFAITGRISTDDVQAVRAIKGELNGLLETMETSIKALDVEGVRAAANKAKKLGTMLSEDGQKSLEGAIDVARAVARKIAKAVTAGEQAALVIDENTLAELASSRTAFLDLDGATELKAPEANTARVLDLAPQADDLSALLGEELPPILERGYDLELEEMLA
jgi:hypothetical protein